MNENNLSFVVNHSEPWNTIEMTLGVGNDSSVTVRLKLGKIKNMPDPTITDLRNIALSWAARELLSRLPKDYLDGGKAPYLPGPRQPKNQ